MASWQPAASSAGRTSFSYIEGALRAQDEGSLACPAPQVARKSAGSPQPHRNSTVDSTAGCGPQLRSAAHLPGPLAGLTMTRRRGGRYTLPQAQQAARTSATAAAACSDDSSTSGGVRRRRRAGFSAAAAALPCSGACQMTSSQPLAVAPIMSAAGICGRVRGAGDERRQGVGATAGGRRAWQRAAPSRSDGD